MSIGRTELTGPAGLGLSAAAGRERRLETAVAEFESQLMTYLVKSMRAAYLAEPEGSGAMYGDLAESAFAHALSAPGGGLNLTGGILDRLRRLDGGGENVAPPVGSPAAENPRPAAKAYRLPAAVPVLRPVVRQAEPAGVDAQAPLVRSGFGPRQDPIDGHAAFHRGLDLAARRGTPVVAAGDGVVVEAAVSPGLGRHVVVRHPGGYETVYAHLEQMTVGAGDEVRAGADIGAVGSSGRSTGPHLHFELRRDGQPVDPRGLLTPARPDWVWPVAAAASGRERARG